MPIDLILYASLLFGWLGRPGTIEGVGDEDALAGFWSLELGVAAGGATIVAATALEISKAIGDYTTATVVSDILPANTTLWVRHTGVASTEVGQYYVQVVLMPKA